MRRARRRRDERDATEHCGAAVERCAQPALPHDVQPVGDRRPVPNLRGSGHGERRQKLRGLPPALHATSQRMDAGSRQPVAAQPDPRLGRRQLRHEGACHLGVADTDPSRVVSNGNGAVGQPTLESGLPVLGGCRKSRRARARGFRRSLQPPDIPAYVRWRARLSGLPRDLAEVVVLVQRPEVALPVCQHLLEHLPFPSNCGDPNSTTRIESGRK